MSKTAIPANGWVFTRQRSYLNVIRKIAMNTINLLSDLTDRITQNKHCYAFEGNNSPLHHIDDAAKRSHNYMRVRQQILMTCSYASPTDTSATANAQMTSDILNNLVS